MKDREHFSIDNEPLRYARTLAEIDPYLRSQWMEGPDNRSSRLVTVVLAIVYVLALIVVGLSVFVWGQP